MTRFLSSIALTIIFVMLLVLIRTIKGEIAVPLSLCVSVMLVGASLSICTPIIEFLNNLAEPSSKDYITLLLKSVGISGAAIISLSSSVTPQCQKCSHIFMWVK